MSESIDNQQPRQRLSLSRIILVGAILIFHAGLVLRFRFVRFFSADWRGYATIGIIFCLVALGLPWIVRATRKANRIALPSLIHSTVFQSAVLLSAAAIGLIGIVWRYQVYAGTPIHPKMGDMLPLIQLACQSLLDGQFPYQVYALPWRLSLTYWPGLWMVYVPAEAFGFDPRHLGLVFSAAVVWLFLWMVFRDKQDIERMLAGWIVLAAFSLSPAIARFSINGHTYPLWFYTAAFGFFILCGYGKTASVCFGIMLATRQTSIIYLPLVITFFWRQGGWKNVFVHLGLMAVSCGLLCLPFALIDIKAFILDPLSEYKKMAHYDFQLGEKSYASKTIGFAFAMKTMGWSAALEWLRLSLLFLILMISWLCVVDRFSLLLSLGATGILFALLAPVSWYYIYVPPLLFLSFAALSEIKPPFSPEGEKIPAE